MYLLFLRIKSDFIKQEKQAQRKHDYDDVKVIVTVLYDLQALYFYIRIYSNLDAFVTLNLQSQNLVNKVVLKQQII